MRSHHTRRLLAGLAVALLLSEPTVYAQRARQELPTSAPAGQPPGAPPASPAVPGAKPAAEGAQPAGPADASATGFVTFGGLNLQNVSLNEVVNFLARQLKINYIMDPRVRGAVTINTYGEVKEIEPRALLDLILRINGAAMVQTGAVYRIVPLGDLPKLPLKLEAGSADIPDDDQAILNLMFLKYASVDELSKLIGEFMGEQAKIWSYPPANLLLLLDSRRNMRRTMELISMFDSDVLARQRVRLFETQHSKPSEIAKELEGILKSISLSKEAGIVRFVPVDRINTLIAVAPNPGIFGEIETWLKRLDLKHKVTTGATDNYVYRVKYASAPMLAMAISALYGGWGSMGMMGMMGMGGFGMGGMGMGGMGGGGYGMGGMGGMGGGGYGMGGMGMGGYGMGGMGMGGYGMGGMGMGGYGMGGYGLSVPMAASGGAGASGAAAAAGTTPSTDLTGQYLGAGSIPGMFGFGARGPRIIPNPMDNTLLIQASPQEYEAVLKILKDLDIPPRQVLIEAKIYEITLSGAFSNGVAAFLRDRPESAQRGLWRNLAGDLNQGGLALSSSFLVGQSKQLLAFLSSTETESRTRVISSPSIIATDSIAASINVGLDVPVLSSQAVSGAQQGGTSVFANTISNVSTGVQLSITARVNPTGIVTLIINQEVSSPQAPPVGGINSPSISRRSVSTQVTLQDGDTIAIGGIIAETSGLSTAGVPLLHRLPIIGAAFGSRSQNRGRSEMVIFMTPRVIYDTNDIVEASEELKAGLRRLQKVIKE